MREGPDSRGILAHENVPPSGGPHTRYRFRSIPRWRLRRFPCSRSADAERDPYFAASRRRSARPHHRLLLASEPFGPQQPATSSQGGQRMPLTSTRYRARWPVPARRAIVPAMASRHSAGGPPSPLHPSSFMSYCLVGCRSRMEISRGVDFSQHRILRKSRKSRPAWRASPMAVVESIVQRPCTLQVFSS